MQQVAVRGMDLERIEAEALGAPGGAREVVADLLQAGGIERRRRVLALDVRHRRRRDGAPAARARRDAICSPPSQGARLEALRPAWASCIASLIGEWARTASSTRASAASLASLYRPRSVGVIRPSGETAVASTISIAAPESARWPRWIRCQSVAEPSSALYWHIGAMMMRLASRSSPIWKGSKSRLIGRG